MQECGCLFMDFILVPRLEKPQWQRDGSSCTQMRLPIGILLTNPRKAYIIVTRRWKVVFVSW